MATLMDMLMQERMGAGGRDYTLGSRGAMMPTGMSHNAFGNMDPINMVKSMRAQGRLGAMSPAAFNPPPEGVQMFDRPATAPVAPAMTSYPNVLGAQPNAFGNLAPVSVPSAPAPSVAPPMPQPVVRPPAAPGFLSRIFSGEDYQSNSMPVVMAPQGPDMTGAPLPQTVNWGDPENAADYFRAAAAAQRIGLL